MPRATKRAEPTPAKGASKATAAAASTRRSPAKEAASKPRATAKASKAAATPAKATKAKATKTVKTTKTAKLAKLAKPAKPAKPVKAAKAVKSRPAPVVAAKEAPVRKAPPKKKPVLDKFLLEQQALLHEERAEYVRQAETLKAEADQLAEDMEPGDIQFDEESGEGTTVNIERERDLALSAQARGAVEEIDRALAKIELGTYGICEKCGEPIPKARLKALPYAALCVRCKSGGLARR